MIQRSFDAAETPNQLHGSFIAYAGRAGDIVDAVAAQRHHIHDFVGRHAEDLLDLGGVADQVVLRRIEYADVLVDQLHHVLVAGDDKHRIAGVDRFAGECADDVIGFEAGQLEDGNAIGVEGAPDVGNLLREIFRHRFAISLVALVGHVHVRLRFAVELASAGDCLSLLIAKGGRADVEDRSEILRREVGAQLAQHVDEDIGRAGGDAGLGGHGSPHPLHRMVRTEDEAHCVDQKDAPFGAGRFGGHGDDGFCGSALRCADWLGSAGDGGRFRGFPGRGQTLILAVIDG